MSDKKTLQILIEAQDKTKEAFQSVEKGTNQLNSSFGGMNLSLLGVIGSFGYLGKKMIDANAEFEQSKIAFSTMLGSAEKANTLLRDLANFASKTPFELKGIEQSAKQLLAFGIEEEKIVNTLKSLGDVAAGLSVPVGQLAYAYGQVRTANQLYGTELRQFMNAGVPLLSEFAKMFGKTEVEIKKMVEEGKIGFKDVEQAFKNMSGEGGRFYDLMNAQSKTFLGRVSNLRDSWDLFLREQGSALIVWAGVFVDKLIEIVNWLKNDAEGLNYVGKTIYGLTLFFKGLGTIVYAIIKTFVSFMDTILGVGRILYALVKDGIENFTNFGRQLRTIFSAIGDALTGNFSEAGKKINEMMTSTLSNTISEFNNFKNNSEVTAGFVSDAWSDVNNSWLDFAQLTGFNQVQEKFGTLGEGIKTKITKSLEDSGAEAKKLSDSLGKYSDKLADFSEKSSEALSTVGEKITEINQKINDLFVDKSKNNLSYKTDIAQAYVDQEEKVKNLQIEWAQETNTAKKLLKLEELNRERSILEEKKTIELAYQNEVNEARRQASLTEFERALEGLEKKKTIMDQEFEAKLTSLQKELNAENDKLRVLNEINQVALKEQDKFLAQSEKMTVNSINSQIEKYNELAKAIARAKSGQLSGYSSVSSSTNARANQAIPIVNITVNGDVSGDELVKKVKSSLISELSAQGAF